VEWGFGGIAHRKILYLTCQSVHFDASLHQSLRWMWYGTSPSVEILEDASPSSSAIDAPASKHHAKQYTRVGSYTQQLLRRRCMRNNAKNAEDSAAAA